MNHIDTREIDRLLSEIEDEGNSEERIAHLESLLLDRPDLQDHYAQVMRLNAMLSYELDGALQHLPPIVAPPESVPATTNAEGECENISRRLGEDSGLWGRRRGLSGWLLAMAATVAIAAYGVYSSRDQVGDSRLRSAGNTTTESGSSEVLEKALVVRDADALSVVSKLTRTTTLTSLQLPRCLASKSQETTLCSGTAWMERPSGDWERGYLVALPPRQLMEVFVDTDATGQNALGVIEIAPQGQMTGGALSFNNLVDGEVNRSERRSGSIGRYSVFNDSGTTKYYLFAGSHMLTHNSGEKIWHQSDYRVQHESPDFLVIGWDDSGYLHVGEAPITDAKIHRDGDYDDIRAMLRFSDSAKTADSVASGVHYSPPPAEVQEKIGSPKSGYRFDVRPGQQLILLANSSAHLQNSVRIAELPSGTVLWQRDGTSPKENDSHFQEGDRGIYIIRNLGNTVRRFYIDARYKTEHGDDAGKWQMSPYKVLDEGDESVTVGFEDSPMDPSKVDWNDIRVHARWFSN